MDYGQHGQSSQNGQGGQLVASQAFFTAGQGSNNQELNNYEPENNLDLTNTTTNWGIVTPAEHDRRAIGSHAIFSSDSESVAKEETKESGFTDTGQFNTSPKLGEIITMNAPLPPASSTTSTPTSTPSEHIYTRGDHLNDAGVAAVNEAINKLSQTGNIVDFYTEVRNMMEGNLKNSFNRKVAA